MSDETEELEEDSEDTSADAEDDDKKGKRLTPAEWKEAIILAEGDIMTNADIARKFDVSPSSITRHFSKFGIVRGSKAAALKEKVVEKVAEKSAEKIARFADKRDGHIEETRRRVYEINSAVEMQARTILINAIRNSEDISKYSDDLKALRVIAQISNVTFNNRSAVLDMDNAVDESGLPKIVIEDLSDEDIVELQKNAGEYDLSALTDEEIDEMDAEVEELLKDGS